MAFFFAAGCTGPVWTATPSPIPLSLSGGALTGAATTNELTSPVPVVIDTGTPITAYDDGATPDGGEARAVTGNFRLLDADGVPRLQLDGVQLFVTPLRSVGVGAAAVPVGGVLGGDNLGRFAMALDYRGALPTMTVLENIIPCGCELANECEAVFPFALAGGQQTIALGTNFYGYPASRVILDVCVEPEPDPVSEGVICSGPDACNLPATNARYQPTGVEIKILVATGFPGLALGAAAYDRLRGAGAAAALLGGTGTLSLHLPDPDDDGVGATGLTVGAATLGDATHSALALVSREAYLGPCGELARSRRWRRSPNGAPRFGDNACIETATPPACTPPAPVPPSPCGQIPNPPDACDDTKSPVAAVVELTSPLDAFVVDDTAPLFQSVNADVRPGVATVEGIVGTEVLQRLVATLDYPRGRFLVRCASDADCIAYPRYVDPSQQSDCEDGSICVPPTDIPQNGGRCFANSTSPIPDGGIQ